MDIEYLVKCAATGDENAWRELVTRYERLLRSVARGMCMRGCDADDAIQQTWLALHESIHTLRSPEHVRAWLCQVMRRQCLRILAQQQGEWLDAEAGVGRAAVPAVDTVVLDETATVLWSVVDRLPDRERRLLRVLFDRDERSYREVAACLAMPVGAIGPVRMRALERLPMMLAEAGITVDDLHAVA